MKQKKTALKEKLSNAYSKVIELELSCYDEIKRDYEILKQHQLFESSFALLETERRIHAIEVTIKELEKSTDPRKLEFLRLKYFEGNKTDVEIQEQLFIEQATFYRWRKEVINRVAVRLGLGQLD